MKLPSLDKSWFVVTTPPRAESLAAEELRLGGIETYLPMKKVRGFKRRHRLILDYYRPLMPGYLFLATGKPAEFDWGRLHSFAYRHVGLPLRGSCGPLCIPAQIVVAISVDEMAGAFDETGATKAANRQKLAERFAEGETFRIVEGPFASFMCMSEGITPQERVMALVEIFGRLSKVEFDPGQLVAA